MRLKGFLRLAISFTYILTLSSHAGAEDRRQPGRPNSGQQQMAVWKPKTLDELDQLNLRDGLKYLSTLKEYESILNKDVIRVLIEKYVTDQVQFQKQGNQKEEIPFRDDIAKKIMLSLSNEKSKHFFLLGESGVGKKSSLRRLAQMLKYAEYPRRPVFEWLGRTEVVFISARTIEKIHADNPLLSAVVLFDIAAAHLHRNIVVYIEDFHKIELKYLAHFTEKMHLLDNVKVIAGTTPAELSKLVKKIPEYDQLFESIGVPDYSPEQALKLVSVLNKENIEATYGVKISDEAISQATQFAKKIFPADGILEGTQRVLHETAVNLNYHQADTEGVLAMESSDIRRAMAERMNLPVDVSNAKLLMDYRNSLLSHLNKTVRGQPEMVQGITDLWLELLNPGNSRNVRVMTAMGSTGVGKTMLAKEFAKKVFKNEQAVLEVNCNEIRGEEGVHQLLGFPLGYLGSDKTSGILNDWLDDPNRGKEGGVIILNEIEKAPPQVVQALMEIMDTGKINGKDGKIRYLQRHLIVMTSNRGSKQIYPPGYEKWKSAELDEHVRSLTQDRLKSYFTQKTAGEDTFSLPPEVLARIDRYVVGRPITPEVAKLIAHDLVQALIRKNKTENGLDITISEQLIQRLLKTNFVPSEGARVFVRKMTSELESMILKARAQWGLSNKDALHLDLVIEKARGIAVIQSSSKEMKINLEEPMTTDLLNDPVFFEKVKGLEGKMNQRLIGQNQVVQFIKEAVISFYGGGPTTRPLSLFLMGTTGTGKTETARALAHALFDDQNRAEIIDFSKVMDQHQLSQIFGAQKGLVGATDMSLFEQALQRTPAGGVLVFDEVSNMGGSNPVLKDALFKNLYEIFEEGKWTSNATGKTYDLSKYIILCTGNDGDELFRGVSADDLRMSIWKDSNKKETLIRLLREKGVPEPFLGRMAKVILMKPLVQSEQAQITQKFLNDYLAYFKTQGIDIRYDQSFVDQITKSFFSQSTGARSVRTIVENRLKGLIAWSIVMMDGKKNLDNRYIELKAVDTVSEKPYIPKSAKPRQVTVTAEVRRGERLINTYSLDLTNEAPSITKFSLYQALSTAYHEAGHAVANDPEITKEVIKYITIEGQDGYLGYARYEKPSTERVDSHFHEKSLIAKVSRLIAGQRAQVLAGMMADAGWSSDRDKINQLVTSFLVNYGMNKKLMGMAKDPEKGHYVPNEEQRKIIAQEIERYTQIAGDRADQIMLENWDKVRAVVLKLVKDGSINEQEFAEIQARSADPSKKWSLKPGQDDVNLGIGRIVRERVTSASCESLFTK